MAGRPPEHQAWEAARTRLVELHPEDWNRLLDEERVTRGLKGLKEILGAQLAKAEAEVNSLKKQLGTD